ncbi:unnamed protein product [Trichobilharzia regenti]|nr:unnamed protein product [Trichobilharzia regenti]
MQTAKLNQFTKYHLVVGGENNGEMNTSSTPPPPPPTTTSSTVPSTNRSVEAATTCSPSVNLLLFSEPITSQLTIVFYIHTLRFNLTKMNCDLVKDLFDNYLLKQFEENQSNNGMNNEEALHTDQAVIQQLDSTLYFGTSMEFSAWISVAQILQADHNSCRSGCFNLIFDLQLDSTLYFRYKYGIFSVDIGSPKFAGRP